MTGAALAWVRGAVRRPGRALLVVLGIWAMAVAVVASLVAADSLDSLFVDDAEARWGPVDVLVRSADGAFTEESTARTVGADGDAASAGWAPRLVLDAVASAGPRREPYVQLLGTAPEEQRLTPPLTGTGQTDPLALGPEEVVLNRRLAGRLGAAPGDRVQLVVAVPGFDERNRDGRVVEERDPAAVPWTVTVAGVADDRGLADTDRAPVALARLDAVQRVTELRGKVTGLYAAALEPGPDAADDLVDAYLPVTRLTGMTATTVKEDALDIAREESGLFRGILLSLALLVVAAAAVVTTNLVVLLGEERSREIAVLRALGARQSTVRRLLVSEGGVYATVAALVGAVTAVPLAGVLAGALAGHFADLELARGREQVPLSTDVRPLTVALGIALVLLTAWLAVRSAARRLAAMDVEDVLRGLPAAAARSTPTGNRRPFLVWSSGLLLLGGGLTASDGGDLLRFLGLSLLLGAWWLHARRRTGDRARLDTRAAVAGLLWCLVAPAALGDFARGDGGVESAFGLLVLAGAGAVVCATVLAGQHLRGLMRYLRGYLPRSVQAPLSVAGAWSEAGRSRGLVVTGTVGTTLFMVAALGVLGGATDIGLERQRGGFDVVGRAVAPLDVERLRAVPGAGQLVAVAGETLPESAYAVEDDDDVRSTVPYPVTALRADAALGAAQSWGLADALPGIASSADAFREVVGRPDAALLTRYTRPEGTGPGDTVVIDDGRGARQYEVVAVLDTYALDGVLLGPAAYDQVFARSGATRVLAAAVQGTSPEALAAQLDERAADRGLVTRSMEQAAAEVVRANRQFTDLFSVLLALGLAIALVAVAALVSRAARERRGSLALLRAMGFRRRAVALALAAEPLLVTAVGVVAGTAAGLVVLRLLFATGLGDLGFDVDWGQLGTVALLTLVLLLALAVPTAARAARRPPAETLGEPG